MINHRWTYRTSLSTEGCLQVFVDSVAGTFRGSNWDVEVGELDDGTPIAIGTMGVTTLGSVLGPVRQGSGTEVAMTVVDQGDHREATMFMGRRRRRGPLGITAAVPHAKSRFKRVREAFSITDPSVQVRRE